MLHFDPPVANSCNPDDNVFTDLIVYNFIIFELPFVSATNSESAVPETEKLCLEGRVQQKLECRPYGKAVSPYLTLLYVPSGCIYECSLYSPFTS